MTRREKRLRERKAERRGGRDRRSLNSGGTPQAAEFANVRVTEDGLDRVTEDGETRVIE